MVRRVHLDNATLLFYNVYEAKEIKPRKAQKNADQCRNNEEQLSQLLLTLMFLHFELQSDA